MQQECTGRLENGTKSTKAKPVMKDPIPLKRMKRLPFPMAMLIFMLTYAVLVAVLVIYGICHHEEGRQPSYGFSLPPLKVFGMIKNPFPLKADATGSQTRPQKSERKLYEFSSHHFSAWQMTSFSSEPCRDSRALSCSCCNLFRGLPIAFVRRVRCSGCFWRQWKDERDPRLLSRLHQFFCYVSCSATRISHLL
jgi:hypothetical protein